MQKGDYPVSSPSSFPGDPKLDLSRFPSPPFAHIDFMASVDESVLRTYVERLPILTNERRN